MPTITLGDLEMFYQERGEGDEAVLALHPSTVSGTMFTWAIPRIEGFRFIVPDQRGHGKTNNPAPDFHLHRFVDDTLGLLDALGIERCHAMGYSMGGAVILKLCEAAPERLKSLIVVGASHLAPTEDQQTQIAGPPEEREGLVKAVMDPKTGLRGDWTFDTTRLKAVQGQVGLIVGDRDPVVGLEDAIELYSFFPNAELLVVPGAGHFGYHTSPVVKTYLQTFFERLVE